MDSSPGAMRTLLLVGGVAGCVVTAHVALQRAEPEPEREPEPMSSRTEPHQQEGKKSTIDKKQISSTRQRHNLTPAGAASANVVLSVVHTHVSRVLEYLAELAAAGTLPRVDVLGTVLGSTKQKKGQSWSDLPILLRAAGGATGAAAVAATLAADKLLSCAIRKVLVVEPESAALSLPNMATAAAALAAQLDAAATCAVDGASDAGNPRVRLPSGKVGVRLQAFPASVLPQLLEELHSRAAASAAVWELAPQSCGLVASVVRLPQTSSLRVGVAASAAYVGGSRQARAAEGDGEAVCRAYYKLQEAVRRAGADGFPFEMATAIDAGSAPGGWTKYLAADRGCERVYSVDPGALDVEGENITHMRCKIQDALPTIAAELMVAGRQVDVFVSDLVPHTEGELMDVVRPLLTSTPRLLRKGALVVLTFKAKATRGFTEARCSDLALEQVRRLDSLLEPGRTRVLHLMANRLRERTIVGYAA
jgi:23S rRNA U2552 (ribose-2'-O)-methylase RlmE/FtsJ